MADDFGVDGSGAKRSSQRRCLSCHTFVSHMDAHSKCSRCRGHIICDPNCDERILFTDIQETDFVIFCELQAKITKLQARIPGSEPPVTTHPPPSAIMGKGSDSINPMNSMPALHYGTGSVNPPIIGFVQERGEGFGDGGESFMDTGTGATMAFTSSAAGFSEISSFQSGLDPSISGLMGSTEPQSTSSHDPSGSVVLWTAGRQSVSLGSAQSSSQMIKTSEGGQADRSVGSDLPLSRSARKHKQKRIKLVGNTKTPVTPKVVKPKGRKVNEASKSKATVTMGAQSGMVRADILTEFTRPPGQSPLVANTQTGGLRVKAPQEGHTRAPDPSALPIPTVVPHGGYRCR